MINLGEFQCACRFYRATEFSEAKLVEPCAFHSTMQRSLKEADAILKHWYDAASPYATPGALKEALLQRPEALSLSYVHLTEAVTHAQSAAQPIDQAGGDMDTRIPAQIWRELVDAHAAVLYERSEPQLPAEGEK